jgi:hypothetical protein
MGSALFGSRFRLARFSPSSHSQTQTSPIAKEEEEEEEEEEEA